MKLFEKVRDFKSDYTTFPKTFETYRWYKPILVLIILFILIYIIQYVFFNIYMNISPGLANTASANPNSATGLTDPLDILISLILAMIIPAVYIASLIVRDRPFSSYLTSVGGWSWELFAKTAAIILAVYLIYEAIGIMIFGIQLDIKLTAVTFLLIIILTPLQSFGEELIFRAYLMQTFGSWFNFPIIALILQAIIFAVSHGYQTTGLISVLVSGLIFGFLTWYSKGLEASGAFHSIHNIIVFTYSGIAVTGMAGGPDILTMMDSVIETLLAFAVLIIIDKKSDWINLKR